MAIKGLRARMLKGRSRAASPRLRLLGWALLAAMLCGLTDIGKPLEDVLRTGRNFISRQQASGDIVVIALDDRSLKKLSRWPWPRRHHAALTDRLADLGAERIFFDIEFSSASDPTEDRLLAEAFARHKGKVVIALLNPLTSGTDQRTEMLPIPMFRANTKQASINAEFDFRGIIWRLPYAVELNGRVYPSFAAELAEVHGAATEDFPLDYSIDYRTIPTISAIDVLERRVAPSVLNGKTAIIGPTAPLLGDDWYVPGSGKMGGVYISVLGAETLKRGAPTEIGFLLPLLLAAALSFSLLTFSARFAAGAFTVLICIFLLAPVALERSQIVAEILPSLLLLTIFASRVLWLELRQSYNIKAVTHPLSGLPNLNALRAEDVSELRPLIVARIVNYAEITSSLPVDMEKNLIEQVTARLCLGSVAQKLYQGDEGVFAWFADDEMTVTLSDHLNALHSLFRSPVTVGETQLDLVVTFGIELGGGRSVANRLSSALMVADEAAAGGLRWKEYDAARLKEAPWRLSLLSQLDAAIDAGELWLAFQPKLDLKTRRTIGAEALVRWTHPEKGPINPAEFVLAAEQSGRIQKLTNYVLERAIIAAAEINLHGISFGVAVNLSARLIDDPSLPEQIAGMLHAHGLDAAHLTLEITETAALGTTSAHLDNLARLRQIGVQISVDDYGTGLSTLDYLKKIPASEIKIDKSFVQAMHRNQGDRVIVDSTIQLAHSLGRRVVAEGVEDREALYALSLMGCDVAQGFFIGRPIPLGTLMRHLMDEQEERVTALG